MSKRRPAITVRWSKRERDWICNWPAWPRQMRQTANFVMGLLSREPMRVGRPHFAWEVDLPGGLLHSDTIKELERRGVDTKAIRITLPLKPEDP